MSDFCKQCSIEKLGEDFRDLAFGDYENNKDSQYVKFHDSVVAAGEYGYYVLCEGCGPIVVNDEGECIAEWCKEHGKN